MFWRIFARELKASRQRLALALLVVMSGAAVVSALVNLQYDMDGKLARTFRSFGANVLVAPVAAGSGGALVLPGSAWQVLTSQRDRHIIGAAPYLYVVARVPAAGADVMVAGAALDRIRPMNSWWKLEGRWPQAPSEALAGANVARELNLAPGGSFTVVYGGRSESLIAAGVVTAGGPEDNQIFVDLSRAQRLAGLPGSISLIQMSVAGSPAGIRAVIDRLSRALPEAEVQPIPEFTAAEADLAGKIRLLVGATVALILALTVLGVLATMAALAVERRGDVGVMKAIGGPTSRIVRLFLAEVGALALGGALAGCAVGLPLSDWISWRVFGSGASPEWEVVPLVAALMFGAALAGALPLRLLGRVRPAAILRGGG
ncbi:MAG TPA: ABC transporter permease [Candidatus Acidoferrales bacterium]|nr:ABC transporter permease [Candidatus Acidoferrales bacterium]